MHVKVVRPTNQALTWKQLHFKRICSSLREEEEETIFITSRSPGEFGDENLSHASGLCRRGIIKWSDGCQNVSLGRQKHVLCRAEEQGEHTDSLSMFRNPSRTGSPSPRQGSSDNFKCHLWYQGFMSLVNDKQFKCQECLITGKGFFFPCLLEFYQPVWINREILEVICSKETRISSFPWLSISWKGWGKENEHVD